MSFFKNFPILKYRFGDNEDPVYVEDLSVYVDLIDQVRDNITYYDDYTILDDDRPDTLSYKLYGTTDYYWTFFLLNHKLRESGWPKSRIDLENYAKETAFPNYTFEVDTLNVTYNGNYFSSGLTPFSNDKIFDLFNVDQLVTVGSVEGIVVKRDYNMGQVVVAPRVESDRESLATAVETGQNLSYTEKGVPYPFIHDPTLTSNGEEYLAAHHYYSSIDPEIWRDVNNEGVSDLFTFSSNQSMSNFIKVTNLEYLESVNEDLKTIKILKKDIVQNVVSEYQKLIKRS